VHVVSAALLTLNQTLMPGSDTTHPRATWIACAVSLALLYASFSGGLLRPLGSHLTWMKSVPYSYSALVSAIDIVVMVALICLAARQTPATTLQQSGVLADPRQALRWMLLWLLPALLLCLAFGAYNPALQPLDLLWKGVFGPFSEELFYRGLAIAALVRLCAWRWWLACLWPALFFAIAHFAQGKDWQSALGIVAITGAGGMLFGWLFVRWRFNLWPAILLHVGLNSLFLCFDLGENALGGWLLNGMRIGVVLIAVWVTVRWFPVAKMTAR
jgi:uncharacterized protein